jgi:hypothetical protein
MTRSGRESNARMPMVQLAARPVHTRIDLDLRCMTGLDHDLQVTHANARVDPLNTFNQRFSSVAVLESVVDGAMTCNKDQPHASGMIRLA